MVPLLGLQYCLNELIFTVLILIKNKISELIPVKQIEEGMAHTHSGHAAALVPRPLRVPGGGLPRLP